MDTPVKQPPNLIEAIAFGLWMWLPLFAEYGYVKYVPSAQLIAQFKRFSIICLGWSVIPVAVALSPYAIGDTWVGLMIKSFPPYSWWMVWIAVVTLSLRGVKLGFPTLSKLRWVVLGCIMIAGAGLLALANDHLPAWATVVIAIIAWKCMELLSSLIEIGRDIYEAAHPTSDSSS